LQCPPKGQTSPVAPIVYRSCVEATPGLISQNRNLTGRIT